MTFTQEINAWPAQIISRSFRELLNLTLEPNEEETHSHDLVQQHTGGQRSRREEEYERKLGRGETERKWCWERAQDTRMRESAGKKRKAHTQDQRNSQPPLKHNNQSTTPKRHRLTHAALRWMDGTIDNNRQTDRIIDRQNDRKTDWTSYRMITDRQKRQIDRDKTTSEWTMDGTANGTD